MSTPSSAPGPTRSASSLRSPAKKAPGSPTKKLPNGFTSAECASIRANYDLETRSRRTELQAQMTEMLATLRQRCQAELERVPKCLEHVSVKEFLERWQGDVVKAAEDTLRQQFQSEQKQNQEATQVTVEQKSPKKRKRNMPETPSVPPSPALPQAKRHAPNNSFFQPTSASTAKKQKSTQQPRRPRRNEPVQAYSMNGSPLGVSTWPQAAGQATPSKARGKTKEDESVQTQIQVPSSDFTFRMTLDSFAQGIRRELEGVDMATNERQQLQQRLMSLVSTLKDTSAS